MKLIKNYFEKGKMPIWLALLLIFIFSYIIFLFGGMVIIAIFLYFTGEYVNFDTNLIELTVYLIIALFSLICTILLIIYLWKIKKIKPDTKRKKIIWIICLTIYLLIGVADYVHWSKGEMDREYQRKYDCSSVHSDEAWCNSENASKNPPPNDDYSPFFKAQNISFIILWPFRLLTFFLWVLSGPI